MHGGKRVLYMFRRPSIVVGVVMSCFGVGALLAPAAAGSVSGSMAVSATVLSSCLTVVPAPMAFGNYDPAAASSLTATSTIAVTCTPGTVASITMDAGQNAGSATAFSGRALKFGTTTLPYQIFKDAARTQVWGDGTNGGSQAVSVTGIGTLTAYAHIPAGASVPAGVYSDTINVTVSF
ncbi:MAG: spore coat U domain-containing protein [Candidatus Eremiobacteraeota bacterium]|nr:spore coat U domain-containing protein [Candidatus Eremiobacteraeota bacterium]